MSTIATTLTFSRAQCQTDSNGLTDATGLIFANARLVDFHRRLVKSGVDASQIQEAYVTGSTPSTGNGLTLLYPDDCLALKTVEVNFTDTSSQNYFRAEQVDIANLAGQNSFSYLRQYASAQSPQFDDRGDWYEIFPALGCTIRLFYFLKPTEYTSTSDTVSYPESQDYRILGYGICADYYNSLTKFDEAQFYEKKYEERVSQYISTLGRGSEQPMQPTVLNVGNQGWNF
jgi:hypothetical protein